MATVKKDPGLKAVKTAKAPRAAKTPPMPMGLRFEAMSIVKAADPAMPDASLAKLVSEKIGRNVGVNTISDYRKGLGLQPVKRPSTAALEAWVGALRAQIVGLGAEPVQMPVEAARADSEAPAGGSEGAEGQPAAA